jgi:hypothetical protein
MTTFALDATPGHQSVTIGGVDVSEHVTRVVVDVEARSVPQVTLYAMDSGVVVGDGIVTVVSDPEPADVLAAAATWLESIDPQQLALVVARRFVSLTDDMVSLTLAVLVELAREASDG